MIRMSIVIFSTPFPEVPCWLHWAGGASFTIVTTEDLHRALSYTPSVTWSGAKLQADIRSTNEKFKVRRWEVCAPAGASINQLSLLQPVLPHLSQLSSEICRSESLHFPIYLIISFSCQMSSFLWVSDFRTFLWPSFTYLNLPSESRYESGPDWSCFIFKSLLCKYYRNIKPALR